MSGRPCHFYQRPGGCRKGEQCAFLHKDPLGADPPGTSTRQVAGNPTRPREATSIAQRPHGACNEFWLTGQCGRNFECRYKHEAQAGAISTIGNRGTDHTTTATAGGSIRNTLNPTQVHNYLRLYLVDHYRFRTSNDIYTFLSLLGNATKENNWVGLHGPDFTQRTHRLNL